MKERREIQAVRMFLPVVIVLVVLNTAPISMFIMVHFFRILYREVYMTTILSITLNSALNFPIYYSRGSSFQSEARQVLVKWMPVLFTSQGFNIPGLRRDSNKPPSSTGSGITSNTQQITTVF